MKIKTSELTDTALDWAAANADGHTIHDGDWYGPYKPEATLKWSRMRSGKLDALCNLSGGRYQPSTEWAQGGPIIEREKMDLQFVEEWHAMRPGEPRFTSGFGPTPLIAAMRCYVASRLGDEIDIPEELFS